jgi:hypothetical protein
MGLGVAFESKDPWLESVESYPPTRLSDLFHSPKPTISYRSHPGFFRVGAGDPIPYGNDTPNRAVVDEIARRVDAQWQLQFWGEHEHAGPWWILDIALSAENFEKAYVYDKAGMPVESIIHGGLGVIHVASNAALLWEAGVGLRAAWGVNEVAGQKVFVKFTQSAVPGVTSIRGGGELASPLVNQAMLPFSGGPALDDFLRAGLSREQADHVLGLVRSQRRVYSMRDASRLLPPPGQVLNRSGVPYPSILDPRTGAAVPFPETIVRTPPPSRVPWNYELRNQFVQEWRRRGFADPPGGWSNYQIHHIQPREWGGTNAFENLVPVERQIHQETVTPWWNNYSGR